VILKITKNKEKSTVLTQANKQVSESHTNIRASKKRAAELLFSVSYAIASGLKVASGCDN
jgi:hypothetical protein